MKITLLFLITLSSLKALAASGSIPVGTVISQLANLSLLVGGLYFFQRKAIGQFFKDKREEFLSSVKAASQSKQDAENKLEEVTLRLANMNSSFDVQVEEAKKNAQESYRTQLADAKNAAEKVKSMAQTSLEFEVQKQIENLRVEAFQKSADAAEKELEKKLTPDQLKVWNNRFSKAKGVQ